MNEAEQYELAEVMAPLTDEQRVEYLNGMDTMPEAEDLASVTKLIEDINAQSEVTEEVSAEVCEATTEA